MSYSGMKPTTASESTTSSHSLKKKIKSFKRKNEAQGKAGNSDALSIGSATSTLSSTATVRLAHSASSSTNTSPAQMSKTSPSSANSARKSNDYIKRVIRLYKKLQHGLVKFESKPNGISKANILRITLLPFLRTNGNDSLSYISFNRQITQTAVTCLVKWWSALLSALKSTNPPISSSDRAVYLECISRIVTRKEWRLAQPQFQKLLTDTLDYSISRLNLKTLSLSVSAFVGKIFAYSFFHLPDASTALLFLLGVKQHSVEMLTKRIFHDNRQANSFESVQKASEAVAKNFPSTVKHIIGYAGKQQVPRSEKRFLNAMIAPVRPVQGIAEPKGLWVKRWSAFDSDVFCSFFRHYLHIVSEMMVMNHSEQSSSQVTALPWNSLAAAPGFLIILAHCYENIDDSIKLRCKKNNQRQPREKDFNISLFAPQDASMGTKPNKLVDTTTNISTNVVKILQTLRDFLHNAYDNNEMLMAPFVIHMFDQTLQCYASTISAYNAEVSGYILDIASEYMANTVKRSSDSKASALYILSMDWNFWICALQNMLETSNINCELKALSTLFNIWDMLPSFNFAYNYKSLPKWFINEQESIKWNITTWLVSIHVFDKYFCHWQPLIRSYYQRLICWRLVVFTNSELSEQDESIRRTIESRLGSIHENLRELLTELQAKNLPVPEMSASTPMANRKVVINRILQNNEFFISDSLQSEVLSLPSGSNNNITRRIHAYEIFDDAIYCSNNPSGEAKKKPTSSSSANSSASSSPSTAKGHSPRTSSSSSSLSSLTSASSQRIPKISASSSSSIVGSALKFFRKPTTISEKDETAAAPQAKEATKPPQLLTPVAQSPLLQPSPQSSSSTSRLSSMLLNPPANISKTFSSLSLSSRSSSPSLMSLSNNNSPPSTSSTSDISDLDSLDFKEDGDDFNDEDLLGDVNPPLPPELDKRAPEILRPAFKFQLVFNDNGLQKQLQVIKDTKFVHPAGNGQNRLFKDGSDEIPKSVKLPNLKKILNRELSAYYYDTPSDDEEEFDEDDSADSEEFIYLRQQKSRPRFDFANSNVSYIGRCINEWNLVVDELERFLENYLSTGGDLHYVDKIVPYLNLEYPNKAVNAY